MRSGYVFSSFVVTKCISALGECVKITYLVDWSLPSPNVTRVSLQATTAKMKEGSAQLLLLRKFFTVLLQKLREHSESLEHRNEKTFTNLRFQVDQYCWFFTHHNDAIDMEEIFFDRVGDKPVDSICSLVTDATTMLKVCRGDMSFPSAYLSGKVKFHGDKKVMKAVAVPIKDAIDVIKSLKLEMESPDASNYSESPSQVSTDEPSRLTAKIVEAFAPNFKYNVEDKSTNRTNQTVSKDVAVRYKIEITNIPTGESWSVAHRYSHFLNLRSELVEQGFRNIPSITSKSSYFNSIGRVVHSRIINLGFFINECLTQVGSDNETLNQFLAKPVNQHAHGDNHSVSGSVAPSVQDADLSSFLHSNLHTEVHHHHDHKDSKHISKAELEALEHAWGSRITWAQANLHHSRYLIKELATQRAAVDKANQQNSLHASNLINRIVQSLRTYSLLLICGVISAYYYEYSHIESNHAVNVYVDTVLKLSLLLLLIFKQTRYYTLFYCVLFLVLINTSFISVSMVNTVVNKYSEHWTMYKSHLKWLTIPHSVVMVPEAYTFPPSVSQIVRNALPSMLYEVVVGSAYVVYNAAKSVVTSTVNISRVQDTVVELIYTPGVICKANAVKLLYSVDIVLCGMLTVYALLYYVLSSPGITRALWIYALGTFLIVTYASLQIASIVLRLSPSVSESLFAHFDAIVAPFVVTQIGLLKSVFVKFAQYFGGRSDVVSAVWTELLCRLQDSCPASSPEYVRRTIETQLGEIFSMQDDHSSDTHASRSKPFRLEDVFDSFELTPIASASIGQVHTATLKHAALMRILHLQQQHQSQNQEEHVSHGIAMDKVDKNATSNSSNGGASDSVQTDAPSGVYSIGNHTADSSEGPVSPQHAPSILTPSSTPMTAPVPHSADTITTMSNNNTPLASSHTDAGLTHPTAHTSTDKPLATTTSTAQTKPTTHVDHSWYECSTDPAFTSSSRASESELVSVVVKVQHEDVDQLMVSDMRIVLVLVKWASFIDSRWETMLQVMRSWDLTMRGELDYQQEAENLREMKEIMGRSGLGAATPYPVPGLVSQKVLVMTRLFGHKVTDQTALMLHNVDREALLCRLAHCSAYQLLVAGVFNADPHAGNILFCLSTKSTPSFASHASEMDAEQESHYRLSTAARSAPHGASHGANGVSNEAAARRTHPPEGPHSPLKGSRTGSSASLLNHKPGNGNSVTFQRHRAHSELSDSSSDEESVVSVFSPSVASTNSYARHIYDATPGKSIGIGYKARSTAGSVAGSVVGSVAGSTNGTAVTGATKHTSSNSLLSDSQSESTARRMIYEATPGRGVGFASELSTQYSPAAVFSPAASSLAPTPSVAAGHTPFPRGAPPLTPHNSSASLLRRRFSNSSLVHDSSFTTQQQEEEASLVGPDIIPGLLDFGMTVRLNPERRRTYCRLIIALCDGDMKAAAAELRTVGYTSNQSDRAPERDAEFFEHLFRDANPRGISKQERDDFNARRSQQKADDIAAGTREKGGRSISTVPDDFLFLTRLVGLLRGLTAELDASCPILYILSLNARIGLQRED